MIRAVLFDFDHTLYERKPTLTRCAPALMQELKAYLRPEVTQAQFTDALIEAEIKNDTYYNAGYQGVLHRLIQMDMFHTAPEFSDYQRLFYKSIAPAIEIQEETYEVLQALRDKGYKLGLLTNGHATTQRNKLSYTRVPEYMDEVVISGETPYAKPDPRAFLDICRRMGLRAEQAVYVGDNIVNDICGARSIGMLTIWRPYCQSWPQDIAPPTFTIQNLNELLPILESLQEN